MDEERPLGFKQRLYPVYVLERSVTEEPTDGDEDDDDGNENASGDEVGDDATVRGGKMLVEQTGRRCALM